MIRLGNWTVSAGVRWDHHQLLANQNAVSPRLSLAQYGQAVVDRVDFSGGRVRPALAIDASVGAQLYKNDHFATCIQADITNLNNRLNVIDFGGLFSGNAIAPSRSYALGLRTNF